MKVRAVWRHDAREPVEEDTATRDADDYVSIISWQRIRMMMGRMSRICRFADRRRRRARTHTPSITRWMILFAAESETEPVWTCGGHTLGTASN